MKKIVLPILLCVILILTVIYNKPITNSISKMLTKNPQIVIEPANDYYRDYDFEFVQNTKSFEPYSYQELLNIIYTMLNNGWDKFTFYCPEEYSECISDLETISDDNVLLTHINNFVHPYNSFENIKTSYYDTGEVTIEIEKLYTDEEIKRIDAEIDKIINNTITSSMDEEEKIKTIHDYIINQTKYDQVRNQYNESEYHSNTAIGPLFEGYAICSGYADVMEIFLEKFNIKSFKVASSLHIWNSVYLDGEYKQLDLTWDDPVTSTGEDYLYYKYFLVDASDLKTLDNETNQHDYDKTVYTEI